VLGHSKRSLLLGKMVHVVNLSATLGGDVLYGVRGVV